MIVGTLGQYITLKIEFDDQYDDPSKWNWPLLLETQDVEIIFAGAVFIVEEKDND